MRRRKAAPESPEHNAGTYVSHSVLEATFYKKKKKKKKIATRNASSDLHNRESHESLSYSPSQGPCCSSESCQFVPLSKNVQCKAESDCSYNSTCNGRSSECPPPLPRANKTRCNEGTQVNEAFKFAEIFTWNDAYRYFGNYVPKICSQLCINGECTGSICLEWNLTECFLTSNVIPNIDKRKLCELACQNGTDPSTCRSTSEFAHVVGLPEGGISLRPGSPCDNFQVKT